MENLNDKLNSGARDRAIDDALASLQSVENAGNNSNDSFYDFSKSEPSIDEPQDWGIHDWDDPASIVAGSGISSDSGGPGPNDTIEGIIVQNGVLYFATVYGLIGDPV